MAGRSCLLWSMIVGLFTIGCNDLPFDSLSSVSLSREAIVDGSRVTKRGDFDAVGALLVSGEYDGEKFGEFVCSGTLIRTDIFLTAAHCLEMYGLDEDEDVTLEWLVSFATDVSQFGVDYFETESISVSSIVLHPDFDSGSRTLLPNRLGNGSDLALLFLEEEVPGVEPISMLEEGELSRLRPNSIVAIAGYGERFPYSRESIDGILYFGYSYLYEIGQFELRVGRDNRGHGEVSQEGLSEKCYGDSGGPTFLLGERGPRLIGVTSRGDEGDEYCQRAGVDTRVDAFWGWIDEESKRACAMGRRASPECAIEASWSRIGKNNQMGDGLGGCASARARWWPLLFLGYLMVKFGKHNTKR